MSTTKSQAIANKKKKSEIRARMREKRRSLSALERRQADQRICANIQRWPAFRRARMVAVFLAFDGEPSLASLISNRANSVRRFVVPVIRSGRMRFAPLPASGQLRRNRFGIAEPKLRHRVNTSSIDIVFVPLVAFDEQGHRLGMGGGYYDRHFNYLIGRRHFLRPRLIGVAYELQQIENAPNDPWDVALHGVVTDRNIRFFQGGIQL